VNHLLRGREIHLRFLTADGIWNVSEVNGGSVRKRENECGKTDAVLGVLMFGVLVFSHDKTRMLAYEAMATSHAHRPASNESLGDKFEQLVVIMRTLRAPGGCP